MWWLPATAERERSPRKAVPLWADPGAVVARSTFRTTFVLTPGGVVPLAPADPKRIAIGFGMARTFVIGTVAVGPLNEPARGGWVVDPNDQPLWFDLFTYGAIVAADWFADGTGSGELTVYELYILD